MRNEDDNKRPEMIHISAGCLCFSIVRFFSSFNRGVQRKAPFPIWPRSLLDVGAVHCFGAERWSML